MRYSITLNCCMFKTTPPNFHKITSILYRNPIVASPTSVTARPGREWLKHCTCMVYRKH